MAETIQARTPDKLLRDLTDDEFQQAYDCDRFTATVLASRYRYALEKLRAALEEPHHGPRTSSPRPA